MKVSDLSKYQKSRLCKCIICGKEITENQDFQFCTTRYKRYNVYCFMHSDCIINVACSTIRQQVEAEEEDINDGR